MAENQITKNSLKAINNYLFRALEVLDEIQYILETRKDIKQMVYEMPKE